MPISAGVQKYIELASDYNFDSFEETRAGAVVAVFRKKAGYFSGCYSAGQHVVAYTETAIRHDEISLKRFLNLISCFDELDPRVYFSLCRIHTQMRSMRNMEYGLRAA